MANDNKMMIVDESSLKDKIYIIRGQQVMLDFDLAEIYGYTTKAFNQQVKNNIERFPDDFRFQLTRIEVEELSRSKILTSMQTAGIKGGRVITFLNMNLNHMRFRQRILQHDFTVILPGMQIR